ncbi:glutamine--tRNA ligase/YqeY domain fusion protein [Neolewinella lacunae]|uniref:Glutamine--tRNA ligase n=1 Tax=Neolewinella lacunae TaxID=1517758 RepID=A0A923PFB0_9BACT|nr:glutamine--tRNA ligase/YqeY domain fusion protein [Neolewinella lacunae]MBC6993017.1 glutamine--tRNA ligase/YqeY domain fusion protein [Neolewinella lacunae]MDN3635839.1 glutamine--tRNA ligase/YqeY domain fusion protein [Neolewinella lacunae]
MTERIPEADNFIEEFIVEDLKNGKHGGRVHTRFPPEPNGYLHIGHAKAIVINFEIGKKYGGKTNLRMDDTNPSTEETHFVTNIENDLRWLGYEWEGETLYASDYFGELYEFALRLIDKGLAYVDDSTVEEIAQQKGDIDRPGTNSPFRDRSITENRDLFERMKAGEFPDGSKVLRAKIDMAHPNLLLRDPVLYRIKHEAHHRTGDAWCIYPLYDFAHGQSDSIEGITHSLCSLEFRHHRDLYNWLIEALEIFPSRQIEFARMNVDYLITSKRKLKKLVEEGIVAGWDDPRMGTLAGMRRKGYPPLALRNFCLRTGVTKRDNQQEYDLLEHNVREVLNDTADRYMAVLDPVKLVLTNYPADQVEMLTAERQPETEGSPALTEEALPFGKELWVEREDYQKEPQNRKYFRLAPGKDVRLKSAYIIHVSGHEEDADGVVTQINATYYPESRSGNDTSGVSAKGTIHWVAVREAIDLEVREYDKLFTDPTPMDHEDRDFLEFINPSSLQILAAKGEPALAKAQPGDTFQFLRKGYYTADPDGTPGKPVFNLTVGLKSGWKG